MTEEQIAKEQEEYCNAIREAEANRVTVEDLAEALDVLTNIVLGGE